MTKRGIQKRVNQIFKEVKQLIIEREEDFKSEYFKHINPKETLRTLFALKIAEISKDAYTTNDLIDLISCLTHLIIESERLLTNE